MYHCRRRDSNPARATRDCRGSNGHPNLYVPDIPPMLSVHEEPGLKEMTSPETEELDGIKSRLTTPPKFWDFDTLLHIQQATVQQADHTHWPLGITVASCTSILLVLLYCYARTQWSHWLLCNPPTKEFIGVELSTTNLSLPNSYNGKHSFKHRRRHQHSTRCHVCKICIATRIVRKEISTL